MSKLPVDMNCVPFTTSLLPPANEVGDKVIFSQVFVCPQGRRVCLRGRVCKESASGRSGLYRGGGVVDVRILLECFLVLKRDFSTLKLLTTMLKISVTTSSFFCIILHVSRTVDAMYIKQYEANNYVAETITISMTRHWFLK